jgi:hypothetical protein
MSDSIARLREQYTRAEQAAAALYQSHKATKLEVVEMARGLMSAARTNELVGVEVIKDDLQARKVALDAIKADFDDAAARRDDLRSRIKTYYAQAAAGTGPSVDWRITLAPGGVYSGWDGRASPGTWAIVDRELCSAELEVIGKAVLGQHGRPAKLSSGRLVEGEVVVLDGYRIILEFAAYRNTCWTETGGDRIAAGLAPYMGAKPLVDEVDAFLRDLGIELQ